jgi:hypothetical protein
MRRLPEPLHPTLGSETRQINRHNGRQASVAGQLKSVHLSIIDIYLARYFSQPGWRFSIRRSFSTETDRSAESRADELNHAII